MKRLQVLSRSGTALAAAALASMALFGCSGDDGSDGASGKGVLPDKSITAPSGPAGQYKIKTLGGAGTTGNGGSGGDIDLSYYYGTGGNIKIFRTGVADAGFTFPATVSTYLGLVPLKITANTTIAVVAAEPAAGTPYLLDGDDNVYISDGDAALGDETPVTGISVATGTTLTFGLNSEGTTASINLTNDFSNAGTVTVAKLAGAPAKVAGLVIPPGETSGNLYIYADTYSGLAGSSIVTKGGPGGNGGFIYIDCSDSDWSGDLTQYAGGFFNRGTFESSGGDGAVGGSAGYQYVWSEGPLFNTGALTAKGGNGTAGAGGNGASIEIETDYGNNFNSGAILTSGGNGATAGGNAGYIYQYIAYPGDLKNSGSFTANGGDGPDGGGNGNYIQFYVYGGKIVNSGNLMAKGGAATTGTGGNGGYLELDASYDSGWEGYYQPLDNWEISGNIDLSGGSGLTGGNGGYIDAEMDGEYVANGAEIIFYGYTDIDTSGGASVASTGGDAGYIYLDNEYGYNEFLYYTPSGGVVNYANVKARGGDSTSGAAGNGGYFDMETDYYYGYATSAEVAYNYGNLDLSGGTGATMGGTGGFAYIWGYNHAENRGQINAAGGNATAAGGKGGMGAYNDGVYILSDLGSAVNAGTITTSGGNGGAGGYGGNAAHIELVGYGASNSAALSAAGGDASGELSTGGSASVIFLYGIFNGTSNSATAFDVTPGTGATAGKPGEVFIDNQNVTSKYLTLI